MDCSIEFTPRCYSKIICHAAKYPHCSVNGVLLSPKSSSSSSSIVMTDAVPLFHQIQGLTPMLEVALSQIETRSRHAGLVISGFYHANETLRDVSVDVFTRRIAEKIAEHAPFQASLVTLDNAKLGLYMPEHALIVRRCSEGGKWTGDEDGGEGSAIIVSESALQTVSNLLQKRLYTKLMDFDNHLDDVTQDYLNVDFNVEVDHYSS